MAQATAKFLEGDLMRHIAVMALSASVGLVSIFLVDFVDLVFIAMLDDPSLTAAVGFASTLLFITFSVTLGLTIAVSALAARMIGAGNADEARALATSAMVFGVGLSVVVSLVFWAAAPSLLGLIGATGDTLEHATRYLRIVVLAMPISTFGLMASGLLRAHGDARRAMMVTLSAGAVNAVLDPIFIFALGLGLEGAAYASVCARFATAITAGLPILRHYGGFAPFNAARFRLDIKPILGLAVPAILTNIATPIGNSVVTRVIAPFGDEAVAGFAVIGRLMPLTFCVIFALSGAVGPIIGQNFGAGNFDRVRGTLMRAALFAMGYVAAAWAVLIVLQGPIATLFQLDADGRAIVFWFALLGAPLFVFNGLLFISNAAFNNLKRPLWSSLLNWGRNTLGIAPFVIAGAAIGGAPGVIVGQGVGGIAFGVLGLWLALRLVDHYGSGRADPDRAWRPGARRTDKPVPTPAPPGE
ncbi:MAG: MATE family efflux transporter [Pseudomonadota bacterium]